MRTQAVDRAVRERAQRRRPCQALVGRPAAARAERAAPGHVVRSRHGALDRVQVGQAAIPGRLGQEQAERVRVQRLFLDGGRGRDLEQRARVEHVDAVAHREGDAQVVRDHDQAHATRDLDGLEQREDLALRRHVERRRRLVGDQDLRIAGQGGGDADALAHAPGQLERIALGHAGIADADLGEAPHSLVAPRGSGRACGHARRAVARRCACRSAGSG